MFVDYVEDADVAFCVLAGARDYEDGHTVIWRGGGFTVGVVGQVEGDWGSGRLVYL